MRDEIKEYLDKNKPRYRSDLIKLTRERDEYLKKEVPDFHDLIKEQYRNKVLGIVIRDLSMNLGVDYESSMIELEDVNLEEYLSDTGKG